LKRLLIPDRVVNPLSGIPKAELLDNVSRFCEAHGLQENITIFQKGALVAQNPDFESIGELDEDDKYHLRRETTHKWHLTKELYWTLAVCSLGSAVQ
jgi:hypothetical protein